MKKVVIEQDLNQSKYELKKVPVWFLGLKIQALYQSKFKLLIWLSGLQYICKKYLTYKQFQASAHSYKTLKHLTRITWQSYATKWNI